MWKYTGKRRPDFAIAPASGQESVWDYPRPPVCKPDARLIRVCLGKLEIAETRSAIRILETASPPTVYLPRSDIRMDLLVSSQGGSFCEWKGSATYWSIRLSSGTTLKNAAWSYDTPSQRFSSIENYLSFYPAIVDCFINDEEVRPQPGGFYGGWVTDEIVGPYKGDTGTSHW